MKENILLLLNELDQALIPYVEVGKRFELYHIGRSALVVQFDLSTATKDIDFLCRAKDDNILWTKVEEQFGKSSANAERFGLYVEGVQESYPPMQAGYKGRAREYDGGGGPSQYGVSIHMT